ncbi:unnamed protein product, partial [Iphiclides podalirius]
MRLTSTDGGLRRPVCVCVCVTAQRVTNIAAAASRTNATVVTTLQPPANPPTQRIRSHRRRRHGRDAPATSASDAPSVPTPATETETAVLNPPPPSRNPLAPT